MSALTTAELKALRSQFPLIAGSDLAYLDNAATTQKPQAVLDAVNHYYQRENANPFRGLYDLSLAATDAYEAARQKVANLIGAGRPEEVIFTRNASESLNLVAFSLGECLIEAGDEVIVGIMEHHSNMLPWRLMAERRGASVKYLNCAADGAVTEADLMAALTEKTKIVAVTQMSNVFGRVLDVKRFSEICHERGIVIVVDGAQSVPHSRVDVQALGVDFLAFSGHKMFSPMGIGVLYGKKAWLEKMPPFLSGGEMIDMVTTERIVYAPLPHKFEAGTVNAGGAVGLGAAIDFVNAVGMDIIEARETALTAYALEQMRRVPYLTVLGSDKPEEHHGILTFKLEGVHPHDITAILSENRVAVRAGHHCAQPLHQHLGIPSTTRASLAFYNTEEEVDRLVACLGQIRKEMGYEQ
ncbi:aminotransferase class V-fold PLP-dependent enzyme [Pseudoramibacter alactolyticus]